MRDKIKDREYIEENYNFYLNSYNERFEIIKEKFAKYLK